MTSIIQRVGYFENITIYESGWLGTGYNSAGLALPGIGIIVGKGAYSNQDDMATVRHEYGHILQSRRTGKLLFYVFVGIPSLLSAWLNWHGKGHQAHWTEAWCNFLARNYFSDIQWPEHRFPAKDISGFTKYWLVRNSFS